MPPEIKRLHYYDQQFLREPDFTDEQQYHMDMRRRHNRLLHGWGVVSGLELIRTSDHVIMVQPGMALDADGREIISLESHEITLPSGASERNKKYYITIKYKLPEDLTDPPPPEDIIDPSDRTRVIERPDFPPPRQTVANPSTTVILGRVHLANSGDAPIDTITGENRQHIPRGIDGNVITPTGWFRFGPGGDGGRIFAEYGPQNAPLLRLSDYDDPPRIQFQQIGDLLANNEANPKFASWIGHARHNSSDIAAMGGNFGVGITPEAKLDINGDVRLRGAITDDLGEVRIHFLDVTGEGKKHVIVEGSSTQEVVLRVRVDEQTKFRLDGNGGVAIGTSSSPPEGGLLVKGNTQINRDLTVEDDLTVQDELLVKGNTRIKKDLIVEGNLTVQGTASKPNGGPWSDISDIRLKKNVHTIENALEKLIQLRGVIFEWKNPEASGHQPGENMGLISQEVEKIFPQWVSDDENGLKVLSISGFEALVVEAFKMLLEKNKKLTKKIEKLEKKLKI